MTFEDALKKLRKLAKGEYCHLKYSQTCHTSEELIIEITCYIGKYEHTKAYPTFAKALEAMTAQIYPKTIKQDKNPDIREAKKND